MEVEEERPMEEDEEVPELVPMAAEEAVVGWRPSYFGRLPPELTSGVVERLGGAELWGLSEGLGGSLDGLVEEWCRRRRWELRLPEDVPLGRTPAELFAAFCDEGRERRMGDWLARTFGHVSSVRIRGSWNAWFFAVIERLYARDRKGLERYERWILRPKDPARQKALDENLATVAGWKLLLSVAQSFPKLRHLVLEAPQGSYYPRWTNGRELPAMDVVRDAAVFDLHSVTYVPRPHLDAKVVDFRPLLQACPNLTSVEVLPSPTGQVNPDFPLR